MFDIVTGGAGFIGSHLCHALLRQGRRVRVLDNLSTGSKRNLQPLWKEFGGQLELCQTDVGREELTPLFEGVDTVYHQAAMTSVQQSVEDPLAVNQANVTGTLRVLLAARQAQARKVLLAGSSAVYGDSELTPKREDQQPDPVSPYAVTKYTAEIYCRLFSRLYGLPTLTLRYFNVFGPRQDPKSEYAAVIPRFITRMLRGQPPIIYGDGEQSRDFIFVEDVVRANLLAAEAGASGEALNIGCGGRLSLNQLVELLNQILGTRLQPVYEAPRPGDIRHSSASIEQARTLIRFQPATSMREGLERTVEWFRRHLEQE